MILQVSPTPPPTFTAPLRLSPTTRAQQLRAAAVRAALPQSAPSADDHAAVSRSPSRAAVQPWLENYRHNYDQTDSIGSVSAQAEEQRHQIADLSHNHIQNQYSIDLEQSSTVVQRMKQQELAQAPDQAASGGHLDSTAAQLADSFLNTQLSELAETNDADTLGADSQGPSFATPEVEEITTEFEQAQLAELVQSCSTDKLVAIHVRSELTGHVD